jgi:hypothetical protein
MISPALAAALGAAAITGTVGAIAIVPSAHAATQVPVSGLPGFGQVVVDMAASRVFVSEGTNASSSNSTTPAQGIVVTDLSGNYLTTIDQGTGAQGLTLAPDGKLYAALSTAGKVAQIDPATYSETDYPLPIGDVPEHVAAQSGKVWVSYNIGAGAVGGGAIGDITPGTTSSFQADSALTPAVNFWGAAPLLAADPSNGGTVVAVSQSVASFNVSGATPAVIADSKSLPAACGFAVTSIAVLPGGQQFTTACGDASATSDPVFSTTDLSVQSASYATPDGSGAIAAAPDGAVATGGSTALSTGTQPPDVNVFSAGGTTPAQSYTEGFTGNGGISLAPGGLAWGDSTVLAAVMAFHAGPDDPRGTPDSYQLRLITYPLLAQSALVVSNPGLQPLGSAISVSGSLTANGAAAPGQTVTISRSAPGGTPVQVGQATTDSGGLYTISDTPPALGTYTYTASFAGDSATAPATDTTTTTVYDPGQITLKVPSTVTVNQSFEVSGRLTFGSGASASGKTVTFTCVNSDFIRTTTTVTTGAEGAFSLQTKLPTPDSYSCGASYTDSTVGVVTALADASLTVVKHSP